MGARAEMAVTDWASLPLTNLPVDAESFPASLSDNPEAPAQHRLMIPPGQALEFDPLAWKPGQLLIIPPGDSEVCTEMEFAADDE